MLREQEKGMISNNVLAEVVGELLLKRTEDVDLQAGISIEDTLKLGQLTRLMNDYKEMLAMGKINPGLGFDVFLKRMILGDEEAEYPRGENPLELARNIVEENI